MSYLNKIGKNATSAFNKLSKIDPKSINSVLKDYNKALLKNKNQILKENLKDVKNIKRKHLIDRLTLNSKRIDSIRNSINEIIKFENPVGKTILAWKRPNGLKIKTRLNRVLMI